MMLQRKRRRREEEVWSHHTAIDSDDVIRLEAELQLQSRVGRVLPHVVAEHCLHQLQQPRRARGGRRYIHTYNERDEQYSTTRLVQIPLKWLAVGPERVTSIRISE